MHAAVVAAPIDGASDKLPRFLRNEAAPLFAAVAYGLLISTLPHWLWWPKIGAPIWIADHDDLACYLSVASQAYHNHLNYLGDAVHLADGVTALPWIQLGPSIVVAKMLGLGPIYINLVWRIWAGITIAVGWYLVIRNYECRSWASAFLAIFLMADSGLLSARPGILQGQIFVRTATRDSEQLPEGPPSLCPQWRIITPGLSLGFFLFYLWCLGRARRQPHGIHLVLASLGFGLLFYVYFYYWTAAGLGLLVAAALDRERRRMYLIIGCFGLLVGMPQLISNLIVKQSIAPDWLQRQDKFLPIPRLSELLVPKVALVIAIVTLVWIGYRRKELLPIWSVGVAALVLINHQVLTGLQIENFHWCYVWGPFLSLIVVLLISGELRDYSFRLSPACGAAIGIYFLHCGSGLWFRAFECFQTRESVEIAENYLKYRTQRQSDPSIRLEPNAVIAGEQFFVDFAVVLENQRPLDHYAVLTSSIDNREWDERIALNGFLSGRDRDDFEAAQRAILKKNKWGPWARDPTRLAERLSSRLASYDVIAQDFTSACQRYGVRYVALPARQASPEYLRLKWILLQNGPHWHLWKQVEDTKSLENPSAAVGMQLPFCR